MEYSPWGHKELGMTKGLTHTLYFLFIQLYVLVHVYFDYSTVTWNLPSLTKDGIQLPGSSSTES